MVKSCCSYNCTERYERDSDISFHTFPKDNDMKNKWLNAMRRKNFTPTRHSLLCSKHFTSDSFEINPWSHKKNLKSGAIPSIFDFTQHLLKKVKARKPPKIRKIADDITTRSCTSSSTSSVLSNSIGVQNLCELIWQSDESEIEAPMAEQTEFVHLTETAIIEETPKLTETIIEETPKLTETIIEETPNLTETITVKTPKLTGASHARKRLYYIGDHKDSCGTPQCFRYRKTVNRTLVNKNKLIKTLRKRNRRLECKVRNLETLQDHLKTKELINEDTNLTISGTMLSSSATLLKQMLNSSSRKYPKELRTFALKLNYYSPKAYNYVRTIFMHSLPHSRTLKKWYQSGNCNPGFQDEALKALTTVYNTSTSNSSKELVSAIS